MYMYIWAFEGASCLVLSLLPMHPRRSAAKYERATTQHSAETANEHTKHAKKSAAPRGGVKC